jgi:hypothetical protein
MPNQALHVLDVHRARPVGQRQLRTTVRHAGAPVLTRRRVGDLRRLLAVVALVRHEVLQDHLLDVPVLGVHSSERFQRFEALLLGLADPHQDPAGERNPQLACGPDRL